MFAHLLAHGYSIQLIYVDCDEETALSRVRMRADVTGRHVPEEVVKTMFLSLHENIEQ